MALDLSKKQGLVMVFVRQDAGGGCKKSSVTFRVTL